MTRTYAYGLHRKKLILLGKWPYSTKNENCFPPLNRTTNSFVSGAPNGCPGDPLAIARGEDPLGPSSINSTVQSPTVNCSYHHSRRRSPSSLISSYARQSVALAVHHKRIECDHDRSQHVCGGGCAGLCGFAGG